MGVEEEELAAWVEEREEEVEELVARLEVALGVCAVLVAPEVAVITSVDSYTMRIPNALTPPGFVTPIMDVLVMPLALSVTGKEVG